MNCDWLFDMSVKRPHGRALTNAGYHLFHSFSRQSKGPAKRDYVNNTNPLKNQINNQKYNWTKFIRLIQKRLWSLLTTKVPKVKRPRGLSKVKQLERQCRSIMFHRTGETPQTQTCSCHFHSDWACNREYTSVCKALLHPAQQNGWPRTWPVRLRVCRGHK